MYQRVEKNQKIKKMQSHHQQMLIQIVKKTIRVISVLLAVVMVFGLAATMIGGFLGG